MKWDCILILSPLILLAGFALLGCCLPNKRDKRPADEKIAELVKALGEADWMP